MKSLLFMSEVISAIYRGKTVYLVNDIYYQETLNLLTSRWREIKSCPYRLKITETEIGL